MAAAKNKKTTARTTKARKTDGAGKPKPAASATPEVAKKQVDHNDSKFARASSAEQKNDSEQQLGNGQDTSQSPTSKSIGAIEPKKASASKDKPERPEILHRYVDQDFREILGKGLAVCRRNMFTVGIFSFGVNILVLAIPIYLFNISDRVLTSRSQDTLVMLTVVVVGAVLMHALLDMMRRFILMRVAVDLECKLGAPVLSAAAKASRTVQAENSRY